MRLLFARRRNAGDSELRQVDQTLGSRERKGNSHTAIAWIRFTRSRLPRAASGWCPHRRGGPRGGLVGCCDRRGFTLSIPLTASIRLPFRRMDRGSRQEAGSIRRSGFGNWEREEGRARKCSDRARGCDPRARVVAEREMYLHQRRRIGRLSCFGWRIWASCAPKTARSTGLGVQARVFSGWKIAGCGLV